MKNTIIILLLLFLVLFIIINNTNNNTNDTFLAIDDTKLLNKITDLKIEKNPVEIQYQIPIPVNQLSDNDLQSIDTDILRNVRTQKNFSITDELTYHQMYSILKLVKLQEYSFDYIPVANDKKTQILDSEKLIAINSGAINNTDLELFTRIKLELISAFNSIIIKNELYTPYNPYHFFKIIKSNMISNTPLSNFIFTITIAREYNYQQFFIYYYIYLI